MAKSGKRKKQKGNKLAHAVHQSVRKKPVSDKQVEQLFQQAVDLKNAGQIDEAEKAYLAILDVYPDHLHALLGLAGMSLEADHLSSAFSYARRAVEAHHSSSKAHWLLGKVLSNGEFADHAESELTIALQLDNQDYRIMDSLGYVYSQQGRFNEAHEMFRRAIAICPDYMYAYFHLAQSKRFTRDDEDFALIVSLSDLIDSRSEEDQVTIHFILGKVFHDCGEFDQAFMEYQQGSELKAKRVKYDPDAQEGMCEKIINTLDKSWLKQLPAGGDPSEGPIFIVGMPRSGTTLLETLLCRHPEVTGIGERNYIYKLVAFWCEKFKDDMAFPEVVRELTVENFRELGEEYIQWSHGFGVSTVYTVDKTPNNFLYLGFILACLPNAKLIHNYRDPADNCLSIYQALFAQDNIPYSYDMQHLGRYYLSYRKMMAHWKQLFPEKILDVNYEDVVADPEQQLRRVVDFCGLPWDDNCMDEGQKQHVASTASVWQARQPVYQSSVKRWRKYEKHLGPLLEVLSPVLDENGNPLFEQH